MDKLKKSAQLFLIALFFSQLTLISCGQDVADEIFESATEELENAEGETDEEDEKKQKAW